MLPTFAEYLNHLDSFDNLIEINREIQKNRNYSEVTCRLHNSSLYKRIEEESQKYGCSWKEFKIFLQKTFLFYESPIYQSYLKTIRSSGILDYVNFAKEANSRKYSIAKIKETFPVVYNYILSHTDPECVSDEERLKLFLSGKTLLKRCPYCGKPIHLNHPWESSTCGSKECQYKLTADVLSHKTPQEKEEILSKRKSTNLKKYGVDSPSKSGLIKSKIAQTNLQRYGVEWTTQDPSAQEKKKNTFLQKYGAVCASKSEEVKNKARQTSLRKYGTPNIRQSQYIKDFFLQKYGTDDSNLVGKDAESIRIFKSPELLKKYFDDHSELSLKEIAEKLGFSGYAVARKLHQYDLDDYVGVARGDSNLEKSFYEFLKKLLSGEEIKRHDRTLIYPQEIDIYLPSKKVAFEIDGNFWHSDATGKPKNYHLHKTLACKKQGVRLIHIFEYELINHKEKILQLVKDILLPPRIRIFARKCSSGIISPGIAKEFFDKNHLQGSSHAPVQYGLFYKGELVACMSFSKPRFNKKYNWEISRFAVKHLYSIPGAAGKLLSSFRENYPGSIITYSDATKMTGNVYRALGFQEHPMSPPNYVWVKGNEVLSRYQTQKHKLLEEGYKGNSENEIMRQRGYSKIYDCGNYVFTMN